MSYTVTSLSIAPWWSEHEALRSIVQNANRRARAQGNIIIIGSYLMAGENRSDIHNLPWICLVE